MAAAVGRGNRAVAPLLAVTWWLLYAARQVHGDENQGAVFLREFTLIRRESLNEDFLSDLLTHNHKLDDPDREDSPCSLGCPTGPVGHSEQSSSTCLRRRSNKKDPGHWIFKKEKLKDKPTLSVALDVAVAEVRLRVLAQAGGRPSWAEALLAQLPTKVTAVP